MTRILLISGSTREGSLHTAALRTATRIAPPHLGATLYGGLRSLPAYVPGEPVRPGVVSHLRDEVTAAGAVLFSTPQYAGSIPGSLKNLLDWLADSGELAGKPVAWLSVAAGGQDDGARTTLESVLAHARAQVLRHACIRIPLDPDAVNEQGMVADPRFRTAVQDVFGALSSALAAAVPQQAPSWQAYSSVYPVVPQRDRTSFQGGRAHT